MIRDVIRDMPIDDRPREKLIERGPENLSTSELLAILIGSGTPGVNALQLARHLLRFGVERLARQHVDRLAAVKGIGPAKAARIAASFELARRRRARKKEEFQLAAFAKKLVAKYGQRKQERMGAAILDGAHQIADVREIFAGTVNYTHVSTREIIEFAATNNAFALVLYHNHPSGRTTPSFEDVAFTKKANEALKLCDIELVDHIIVGGKTYTSMRCEQYF
jgi:DNA repair protein RadC